MKIGDRVNVIADLYSHNIAINTTCIVLAVYEVGSVLVQEIDGIKCRVLYESELEII